MKMTEREFCIWLKGFMEYCVNNNFTPKQINIIRQNLDSVFIEPESDNKDKSNIDMDKWKKIYKEFPPYEPSKTWPDPNTPKCLFEGLEPNCAYGLYCSCPKCASTCM